MLNLKEGSPLEMLRQFAKHLKADLIEDLGAAMLKLNNKNGKGSISLYEINPGLTAWIYDIKFTSDLVIDLDFSESKPYYFGYNVSGYQLQKFPEEKEYQRIEQNQNFILISEKGTSSEFVIPNNTQYECCYLIINPILIKNSRNIRKRKLQLDLKEAFDFRTSGESYRYFGNIDTKTGTYAKIVVRNKRTDLVGRLHTEGAIINMLGSQIEAHDKNRQIEGFQPNLSKSELSRITTLGDYIIDNINKSLTILDMSIYLGMSQKKMQAGIKFLFGSTANEYNLNIRLEYAKEQFNTTDKNISEICYSIGYQNRSNFSKRFKERYGMLPSEYKLSLA